MHRYLSFNVTTNVTLPQVKHWPGCVWNLSSLGQRFPLTVFYFFLKENKGNPDNPRNEIQKDSNIITLYPNETCDCYHWLVKWSTVPKAVVPPWCLLSTWLFSALSSRQIETLANAEEQYDSVAGCSDDSQCWDWREAAQGQHIVGARWEWLK